jgi:hypothetical protein
MLLINGYLPPGQPTGGKSHRIKLNRKSMPTKIFFHAVRNIPLSVRSPVVEFDELIWCVTAVIRRSVGNDKSQKRTCPPSVSYIGVFDIKKHQYSPRKSLFLTMNINVFS